LLSGKQILSAGVTDSFGSNGRCLPIPNYQQWQKLSSSQLHEVPSSSFWCISRRGKALNKFEEIMDIS
jgi:hypothetical protein